MRRRGTQDQRDAGETMVHTSMRYAVCASDGFGASHPSSASCAEQRERDEEAGHGPWNGGVTHHRRVAPGGTVD